MQVLPIKKDDVIAAMLPVSDFLKDKFLVLCTEKGVVKKTPLSAFADVRSSGIAAIKLRVGTLTACCCFVGRLMAVHLGAPDTANLCSLQKGDQLLWVGTCTSGCSIVLASSGGRAIHFCADDDQIRPLGRAAAGIKVCGSVSRSSRPAHRRHAFLKCLSPGEECAIRCCCCLSDINCRSGRL